MVVTIILNETSLIFSVLPGKKNVPAVREYAKAMAP
jgi:hypothetical protein